MDKAVIKNEYDYSGVIPTVDNIAYLVQYCDQMNKQLTELVKEDTEKNKQYKDEYKEYKFGKSYGQGFSVYVSNKDYSGLTINDNEEFLLAIKAGKLKNIHRLVITLNMDFRRGVGSNPAEHENTFEIVFEPYDIKFTRKSNFSDPDMDQIEEQINSMMSQMPTTNTIFYSK